MTKRDFILTGRNHQTQGEEFPLPDSEYADDTGVLFDSRDSLVRGIPFIIDHFRRFGMEIHVGNTESKKDSKSEILFVAKPAIMYTDPETYDGRDLSNVNLGSGVYIPVVDKTVYLGSVITRDCSDSLDVDARVKAAGNAFGALRHCLFSSASVSYTAKKFVYTALVLSILLYGAECWSQTEKLYNRLRTFHARCVRAMCRVTRKHTREHRISTFALLKRIGLRTADAYVTRRQLRWAGHVARMDFSRLPRKLLSSWVRAKRPHGSPQFTYGRGLRKALRKAQIDMDAWAGLAQDRSSWRDKINTI